MSDRLTDEQVANITRRRFTNDPIGNLVAELLELHLPNVEGRPFCPQCGVTPCPTVRLITEATQ